MTDLYKILGVRKNASKRTIKKAYHKKAMQHHPDRNPGDDGANKRFQEVQHAYDVLTDDERRARYDRTGDIDASTKPPESDSASVGILASLLTATMAELQRGGKRLKEEDIVGHMHGTLAKAITELNQQHRQLSFAKMPLVEIVDRFVAEAGVENVLEGTVKRTIESIDVNLTAIADRIAITEKAKKFLDKFTFKFDPTPFGGRRATSLWSISTTAY